MPRQGREKAEASRRHEAETMKESVRAKIRAMVNRKLRKYDYPPDKQEKATRTVLEQAELLCGDWAEQPAA
jgi:hypothetical protein